MQTGQDSSTTTTYELHDTRVELGSAKCDASVSLVQQMTGHLSASCNLRKTYAVAIGARAGLAQLHEMHARHGIDSQ